MRSRRRQRRVQRTKPAALPSKRTQKAVRPSGAMCCVCGENVARWGLPGCDKPVHRFFASFYHDLCPGCKEAGATDGEPYQCTMCDNKNTLERLNKHNHRRAWVSSVDEAREHCRRAYASAWALENPMVSAEDCAEAADAHIVNLG